MWQRALSGSGGGGGRSTIRLRVEHKTEDSNTIYRYVYIDDTLIKEDSTLTVSKYGGVFDSASSNQTITFMVGSDAISWDIKSTSYSKTYYENKLSKNSSTAVNIDTNLNIGGNLSKPYDVSLYML